MSHMFKPNREFQAGLQTDDYKKKRQNDNLSLRRKDRQRRLENKRQKFNQQRRQQQTGTVTGNNTTNNGNVNNNNFYGDISNNGNNQQAFVHPNRQQMLKMLPRWVEGCYTQHPGTHYECVTRIRQLLSIERNPPINEVIQSGVIPRLIQFLKNNNYTQLQFEAAWTLTNIASGTAENTAVVIRNGAIPIFVNLVKSSDYTVQEQAIWALGNIAGDSPECRNLVLDHNVMSNLLPICKNWQNLLKQQYQNMQNNNNNNNNINTNGSPLSLLKNVSWVLSNFCRGKPQPNMKYVVNIVECLYYLINVEEDEIYSNFGWAFSYLTSDIKDDDPLVKNMHDSGITDKLINLLDHDQYAVRQPALRSIGNIATGSDHNTEFCIQHGVLVKLSKLLSDNSPVPAKREICWTVSNITAGNNKQIEAVIKAKIFPLLIDILKRDKYDVAKEALWAISNATSGGTDNQIKFLVNLNIIPVICSFIPKIQRSNKLLLVTLECLENILQIGKTVTTNNNNNNNGYISNNKYADLIEECGGLDTLEKIQANDNIDNEIYEKIYGLLNKYWGHDDNNDNINIDNNNVPIDYGPNMNINNPTNNTNPNQFGFGFQQNNQQNNNNNNNPNNNTNQNTNTSSNQNNQNNTNQNQNQNNNNNNNNSSSNKYDF